LRKELLYIIILPKYFLYQVVQYKLVLISGYFTCNGLISLKSQLRIDARAYYCLII